MKEYAEVGPSDAAALLRLSLPLPPPHLPSSFPPLHRQLPLGCFSLPFEAGKSSLVSQIVPHSLLPGLYVYML